MKKYLFYLAKLHLITLCLLFNFYRAQTTLFQEDFEGFTNGFLRTTSVGGWVADVDALCNSSNYWSIYNAQYNLANRSLMISAVDNVCRVYIANYFSDVGSNRLVYTSINAVNYGSLVLDFDWRSQGEYINGAEHDYGELLYRVGTAGPWTVITTGGFNNTGKYYNTAVAHQTVNLDSSLNNTSFQLGFRWINNANSLGTRPPFVIDNIVIKGAPTVICNSVTALATKNIICPGESVTLSASSSDPGYTFKWYTNWNNTTNTGNLVGSGSPLTVSPTQSEAYRLVATKPGCSVYDYTTVAISSTPTAVTVNPASVISCLGEVVKLSVTAGGQIPAAALAENFNPGHSIAWLTEANVTGGNANYALWSLANPADPTSFYVGWNSNSPFAVVNSDLYGFLFGTGYSMNSSLISPPFSLQDYTAPINLTFNHYFRQYMTQVGKVEISTDSGLTWTMLKTYNTTVGSNAAFALETINLNAYAGMSNVKLRFNYYGKYDYYWAVDNVEVKGVPAATTITWSPATGLYNDSAATSAYVLGTNMSSVFASPTATTTYTVSATTSVGCPSASQVIITRGDKDWTGISGTDWGTPGNWLPTGIPTASHCVNIPSTGFKPVIAAGTDAFAKNLTVKSGAGLAVNGNFTVTDYIKNQATDADVIIASDANLKQITDSPVPGNSGSVTVKRNIKFRNATREEYNYLISPVVGQSLKTIYPGVPTTSTYPYVLYYNEATNYFSNSTGAYIPGRGLAVKEPKASDVPTNNVDAVFKGAPANGIITFPLAFTDNVTHGYNLVGNPYPSNIDLQALYVLNGGTLSPSPVTGRITSTFYFWDNAANTDYQQQGSGYSGRAYAVFNAYNGTGNEAGFLLPGSPANGTKKPAKTVKVAQGFMVRATAAGNNMVFNNSVRVTTNGSAFFSKPADSAVNRYWVELITPANLVNSIAVVHFPGGRSSFGMDDSELNVSTSDMLYSLTENNKVQIEGRPDFINTDRILLGTAHFMAGNYTLALGSKEGIFAQGQSIYLKDSQTGIITNLSEGNYTFAANAGESTGRFEIIYKPETVLTVDSGSKEELKVYRDGSDFVVKAQSKKITQLEVFDSAGRLIDKTMPNAMRAVISGTLLNSGMYIIKADQSGLITAKKIIK